MQQAQPVPSVRVRQLDDIAEALPQRAAALARLFIERTSVGLSRTEIGVLRAVAQGPQRVTDLAAGEGVTQPAITMLVNRLAQRAWLERVADPLDRRAVLVRMTPAGRERFDALRAEYRALLHEEMASLGDDEVETLARAVEILDGLVARLQERTA
jgi:DNA-binding MarR family transcriptional regulator